MAIVAVVGHDPGILRNWTHSLRAAGHECTVLPPGEACESPVVLCLYDLGTRGGADPRPLTAAIAAEPRVRFVAMTARPDLAEGLELLRAGVRGYCNRLAAPAVLNALVTTVDSGALWAGKQVTDHLLRTALREAPMSSAGMVEHFSQLTPRELAVAHQVGEGLSNKVIAAESGISERTVKAHLNSIFRKTGLRNRVQLALAIAHWREADLRRTAGPTRA